ncbi:lycopene cyclase family protein [Autumnicola musiva]|uniref:Lycopene cyclase family protein n=1 Tax=Autumnicola musiva TaxID=3075589 RepID=A0ABU3DAL7_9FLAO|nr:lycopene cyclase family protein [Zunongwangia sp. F117]MDT0678577.1 lycopene cyclase family protein [Zunongwangia sp. F117]
MGPVYYYVIIGGGLAGLQLAQRFSRELFFKGKKIAIIDPSEKDTNDKTWCFWEKGEGQWDHIVSKSWKKAHFYSSEEELDLDLTPYTYKKIKSLDFYTEMKKELESSPDIVFIKDRINEVDIVKMQAIGENDIYPATHFFDSRIPQAYTEENKYTKIFQHFKGWQIETENDCFDPETFTMMDYRLKHKDSTSFIYILPQSAKKALIEFTFFTPYLTEESIYDEMLKRYISEISGINTCKITSTESGIIPMTDFPFEKSNNNKITKIGTGGGWVKPSTGYSFKNTEKKTARIIRNIKSGFKPGKNLVNKRFRKYDAIFLDVLAQHNGKGERIFTRFYKSNSVEKIFRYLDEETSFSEDMKIMFSLFGYEFIESFFRKL